MTGGKLGLAVEEFGDFLLHQLLVEQLAAGDAVDLGAQRRNAILIGLLHACLPRRGGADEIVAQHEVGRRQQIAYGNRRQRRAYERGKPGAYGEMPYLIAPGDDDRVGFSASAEDR